MNATGVTYAFDPRTWLVWGSAAAMPLLVGRNPFVLAVIMLCVGFVYVELPKRPDRRSLRWIVRLAFIFGAIGILFNVLTVHVGNVVLFSFPGSLPIIGGIITLNAVVYGTLSGASIFTLVVIGVTVASMIDWSGLVRLLPSSMLSLGMAGSVAFNFLPQTIESVREVREARLVRGLPKPGPRDFGPIAAAILTSGLERAFTTAELLEARGFGASIELDHHRSWRSIGTGVGLAAVCGSIYLSVTGNTFWAIVAGTIAAAMLILIQRLPSSALPARTKYREMILAENDLRVIGGALVALATAVITLVVSPESLRYEPFPVLDVPSVSLALLLAQCGLIVPGVLLSREPIR